MGDYGNSPRPNPLARAQRRASSKLLHNRYFFFSLGKRELQFPRALSAPPRDVALPLTLMPRPPASPGPSLPVCVSVTQRRFEAEGRSGAPPPPSPAPATAAAAAVAATTAAAAVRRHRICLQPGELTTKRARASLSSPRSAPRSIGLAGLGGWREGGGLRWCLRSTGARAAPAPRVSVRRTELAFRPPAVVR